MKQLFTALAILFCISSFGQKESNIWYFGTNAGIDFNCNPPRAIDGINHEIIEGCSTISDSLGNFLFATDGDSVWDKHKNGMPNGFGLGGECTYFRNSSTQAALILPKPGNDSIYYVFTTDCIEDTLLNGFRYSIVDMNLNNGNGDVILKNQLLFHPSTEKIASVKHQNNIDYWIVAHEYGTNNFYSYLLTSSGISTPIVSSTGQTHLYTPIAPVLSCAIPEQIARGYLKFSPDGSNLVSLECPDDYPQGMPLYVLHPEIFSFDNSSGAIQSMYVIDHPDSLVYYGASFSPDGSKLYLSGAWFGTYIHQYNLLAGSPNAIVNSRTIIYNNPLITPTLSAMQLATDGKLYISSRNTIPSINVINDPNALGVQCNYQPQAITLYVCPDYKGVEFGLPNFCESYFQTITPSNPCLDFINADFSVTDTCLNNATHFTDQSTIFPETINFWKWDFGDPASGALNFSNFPNPSHLFTSSGTFNVRLIAMTDTLVICKSDTIIQSITIQLCTGVSEFDSYNTVFYPNPATDQLTIESNYRGPLLIYDLLGQLKGTYEKAEEDLVIDVRGYYSGIYLMKTRDNGTFKFSVY